MEKKDEEEEEEEKDREEGGREEGGGERERERAICGSGERLPCGECRRRRQLARRLGIVVGPLYYLATGNERRRLVAVLVAFSFSRRCFLSLPSWSWPNQRNSPATVRTTTTLTTGVHHPRHTRTRTTRRTTRNVDDSS